MQEGLPSAPCQSSASGGRWDNLTVGREEDPGANLDGAKPGACLARAPAKTEQSQDLSSILSVVLQDLHSQETVRTFTLRAISMQVRSKVRGMHCFVLKPKQDYLFNFPNTLVAPW